MFVRSSPRFDRFCTNAELIGLSAFALGYPLSKALANIGLALLLTVFALQLPRRANALWRDPLTRLSGCWILWVLGYATFLVASGDAATRPFSSITEIIGFGFIPLVAWALRGDPQRLRFVLTLAITGVALRILADANWTSGVPSLPYGENYVQLFGVNRNVSGGILAAALLGSLLIPLAWRPCFGYAPLLLNIAFIGLLCSIWIETHARATWIAVMLALPVALLTLLLDRNAHREVRRSAWLLTAGILMLGLYIWHERSTMEGRLGAEPETWTALLSGNLNDLPETSIGIRFRLAEIAFRLWQERPLFGWGSQIQHLFGTFSDYPRAPLYSQLHNGYLEMLARTGLVGAVFALAALGLTLRNLVVAQRAARLSPALSAFLAGSIAIFLVENGAISFMYFQHGWQYMVLVGGLINGCALRHVPPPLSSSNPQSQALQFWASRGGQLRYFRALSQALPSSSVCRPVRTTARALVAAWFRSDLPTLPAESCVSATAVKMGERINGYSIFRRMAFSAHRLPTYLTAYAYLRYYTADLLDKQPQAIAVWNGEKYRQHVLVAAAEHLGIPALRFENGILPRTTTLDAKGVNARNSIPREPDFFKALAVQRGPWQGMALDPRQPPKDKPLWSSTDQLPERYLLIPFQVDTDTQILNNSPWIRHMRHLYFTLVSLLSQVQDSGLELVFKEHPSSSRRYPSLHRHARHHPRVHFINDRPLEELLSRTRAVVTVNSTVGIEALLSDCAVITLGDAFYNVEGLVQHAGDQDELCRIIDGLDDWKQDVPLRDGFFHYLAEDYAVPGVAREASHEHLDAMCARIQQLLDQGHRP